jgi:hypothetical protein
MIRSPLHNELQWEGAWPADPLFDRACGRDRASAPETVAAQIDAMSVVDQAVQDGVGIGWMADKIVPAFYGDLAGQDGRAPPVAFFEDLVEVVAGAGVERLEAPIVELR